MLGIVYCLFPELQEEQICLKPSNIPKLPLRGFVVCCLIFKEVSSHKLCATSLCGKIMKHLEMDPKNY